MRSIHLPVFNRTSMFISSETNLVFKLRSTVCAETLGLTVFAWWLFGEDRSALDRDFVRRISTGRVTLHNSGRDEVGIIVSSHRGIFLSPSWR